MSGIILQQLDKDELISEVAAAAAAKVVEVLGPGFNQSAATSGSSNDEDKPLSRSEAADFFGVSTVTIDNWTADGILTGYRIAKRVYYKKSELLGALKEMRKTA